MSSLHVDALLLISLLKRYEKSRVIGPLHTGGPAAVDYNGTHIATCVGEEVIVTRLSDGEKLHRLVTVSLYFLFFCS